MIGFELGREFKLSIAEINNVFPDIKIIYYSKKILIIENNININEFDKLGGVIKIFKIKVYDKGVYSIENIIKENIDFKNFEGKFNYSINTYPDNKNLKEILKLSKNVIKNEGFNPRFINKDFKNLTSIQIIKEALVKKETDFNFIFLDNKIYFGKTIWVQNIYSYSNRDYGKETDMNIGMLPPKLAQMMINFSGGKKIYDPFVGLGTILIESIYMGNSEIFGSDLNKNMVKISNENLEKIQKNFNFDKNIFYQNAKFIKEVDILNNVDAIVSEGYLGEIMTKKNISVDRIQKQKEKLIDLYEGFFSGLKDIKFKGIIVISFPFWEIKGKYFYFKEIYDILKKYTNIQKLLPSNIELEETKIGSLLYKRDSQLVGREIFKLKIK